MTVLVNSGQLSMRLFEKVLIFREHYCHENIELLSVLFFFFFQKLCHKNPHFFLASFSCKHKDIGRNIVLCIVCQFANL